MTSTHKTSIFKKHLVFVSSTYEDLKEARSEVAFNILKLDCIPTGMELFGSRSEDAWKTIQKTIDEVDLFILIIGGKYGSSPSWSRFSYTELEYNYAKTRKKAILPFIIQDAGKLQANRTEDSQERKQLLLSFVQKVKGEKSVAFWQETSQLNIQVTNSIFEWKKHNGNARSGWINLRGDGPLGHTDVVSDLLHNEIINLANSQNKLHNVIKNTAQELIEQLREIKSGRIKVPTHVLYEQIVEVIRDKEYNDYYIVDHAIFRWNELIIPADKIAFNIFDYSNLIIEEINERAKNKKFHLKRLFLIDESHLLNPESKTIIKDILTHISSLTNEKLKNVQNKIYMVKRGHHGGTYLNRAERQLKDAKDIVLVRGQEQYIKFKEDIDFTSVNKNANATHSSIEYVRENQGDEILESFNILFKNAWLISDFVNKLKNEL